MPGAGWYGTGTLIARAARSSHSRRGLCWAVSTMRRCMVPSGSIRVATTLISPFCPPHSAVGYSNVETRLAGPDRLDDRLERPDSAKGIDQHRPGPHRGRLAGAQPLAQHRQAERAIILLGQHA